MPICNDKLNVYKQQGFDIEFEEPRTRIESTENMLTIKLNYPIIVKNSNSKINFENFEYNMPTSSRIDIIDGIINKGDTLISENKNAALLVNQDTIAHLDNSPIEEIEIKIMDKNFDEQENDVVLGGVVYKGEPAGAIFDPPVEFTIKLKKSDLPKDYDIESPKIGWFSEETGLWRTYNSCGVKETEEHYIYCGLVDHFTPIALLGCGVDKENEIFFSMYGSSEDILGEYIPYKQIIEPAIDEIWMEQDNSYYMVPEYNSIAWCDISENREYELLEKGGYSIETLCDISTDDQLFRDWDKDDQVANIDAHGEIEILVDGINYDEINNMEYSKIILQEECYRKCKIKAKNSIKCYFNEECGDYTNGITPIISSLRYDPYLFSDKEVEIISGDGITDGIKLTCDFEGQESQESDKIGIVSGHDDCVIENNNLINLDSIDSSELSLEEYYKDMYDMDEESNNFLDDIKLAEYVLERMGKGFFATPKSFGYENVLDKHDDVTGTGNYMFEIQEDTCIDSYTVTPESIEASIILSNEGNDVDIDFETDGSEIEQNCNDEENELCIWGLNLDQGENAGMLRVGMNTISVKTQNEEFESLSYAKGILKLKGIISAEPNEVSVVPEDVIGNKEEQEELDNENLDNEENGEQDEETFLEDFLNPEGDWSTEEEGLGFAAMGCLTGGAVGLTIGLSAAVIGTIPGAILGCATGAAAGFLGHIAYKEDNTGHISVSGAGLSGCAIATASCLGSVVGAPAFAVCCIGGASLSSLALASNNMNEITNAQIGDSCNKHSDCESLRCGFYECKEKLPSGSFCDSKNDCISDKCTWLSCE